VRAGAHWYDCTEGRAVTYPSRSTPQQGQYRSSSLVGSYQLYSSRPLAYQEWPQLRPLQLALLDRTGAQSSELPPAALCSRLRPSAGVGRGITRTGAHGGF
jgi:hypothetical protein